MDEVPTRSHAEAHAKAVVDGDMEAVTADFAPALRDQVPEIAKSLPQPVTDAEVMKVDMGDDHATVRIQYSNDTQRVTIQTRWEHLDGRPMIVDGAPVED
jgi:hypothetical protein